ncbi:MAG TPA: carbohydrate kinase family protein, partial [Candidatus Micrarchaeota archaeon]|nr:carbohydrate kinase family protein [Candidatus Micrarchaeota archaeon]
MPGKNQDVLTVGHILYDVRCYVDTFPQPDKSSVIEGPIHSSGGGSAANVAINLSMLGRKCGIACNVGSDRHGAFLHSELKKSGIDLNGVQMCKGKSGMSIVLVDKNAEVEIIESLGVSDNYVKVGRDYVSLFKHLHVTGMNLRTTKEAITCAYKAGLSVSYDSGRFMSGGGEKEIGGILFKIDQLIINRKELATLVGKKAYKNESGVVQDAKYIAKKYALDFCVKGGKERTIVARADGSHFAITPYKVKVIDTIGAGDAFAAGFIDAFLEGRKIGECARFASACSAEEIMRPGAHSGLDKKLIFRK